MRGYTHLAAGLLIGLLFAKAFPGMNTAVMILICLLGSAFPDIDHSHSLLGRYFKIGGKLFRHRGLIHSLFSLLLFSAIVFLFSNKIYAAAFAVSYLTHLLTDMFSGPIHLLLPLKKRFGKNIPGSSIIDVFIFAVLILLDLWLILV